MVMLVFVLAGLLAPVRWLLESQRHRTAYSVFAIVGATKQQAPSLRPILAEALRDPRVARLPSVLAQDDPLVYLEETIAVEHEPSGHLFSIRLSGTHPDEQLELVRAVTDAYVGALMRDPEVLRQQRQVWARDHRFNPDRRTWPRFVPTPPRIFVPPSFQSTPADRFLARCRRRIAAYCPI